METLNYAMLIEATPQQVWQVLWNPDTMVNGPIIFCSLPVFIRIGR